MAVFIRWREEAACRDIRDATIAHIKNAGYSFQKVEDLGGPVVRTLVKWQEDLVTNPRMTTIDRQSAFSGTREVAERLRFDVARLEDYLSAHVAGFAGPIVVSQFNNKTAFPMVTMIALCATGALISSVVGAMTYSPCAPRRCSASSSWSGFAACACASLRLRASPFLPGSAFLR